MFSYTGLGVHFVWGHTFLSISTLHVARLIMLLLQVKEVLTTIQSRLYGICQDPKSSNSGKAKKMLAELKKPLVVIPVTGVRGSGKTTSLNALLHGK